MGAVQTLHTEVIVLSDHIIGPPLILGGQLRGGTGDEANLTPYLFASLFIEQPARTNSVINPSSSLLRFSFLFEKMPFCDAMPNFYLCFGPSQSHVNV